MLENLLPSDYLPYILFLPDVQSIVNLLVSLAPLYTYGTACWSIYNKKTSAGFSIDICATMLMASILRIFYYFIEPYEKSLLRQAIVMLSIQGLLLKISLKFRPSSYDPESLDEVPDISEKLAQIPKLSATLFQYDSPEFYKLLATTIWQHCVVYSAQAIRFFDVQYKRPFHFWQWVEESFYWKFLQFFALILAGLTIVLRKNYLYSAIVGITGLFIEALLPLPQILMLQRQRTVKNFKVVLLISWLSGDLVKLSYLIYGTDDISWIFIVAGLFQMSLDLVILYQYVVFLQADKEKDLIALPLHELQRVGSPVV